MPDSNRTKPSPRFETWKPEEIKILTTLWIEGLPIGQIAQRLKRTPSSVKVKAFRLGLQSRRKLSSIAEQKRSKKKQLRPCLRCKQLFYSLGIGNRICDACKSTTIWETGNDFFEV